MKKTARPRSSSTALSARTRRGCSWRPQNSTVFWPAKSIIFQCRIPLAVRSASGCPPAGSRQCIVSLPGWPRWRVGSISMRTGTPRLPAPDDFGHVAGVLHEPKGDVDADLFVLDQRQQLVSAVGREGSHRVSAPRAVDAERSRVSGMRSQRDAMPNMRPWTASEMPRPRARRRGDEMELFCRS